MLYRCATTAAQMHQIVGVVEPDDDFASSGPRSPVEVVEVVVERVGPDDVVRGREDVDPGAVIHP